MSDFKRFSEAVHTRLLAWQDFGARLTPLQSLEGYPLYVAEIDGEALWQVYLSSFPEGTNPMFVNKTEHDCRCCKRFLTEVGRVVLFDGEKVYTLWGGLPVDLPYPYNVVAATLHKAVSEAKVGEPWLPQLGHYGQRTNSRTYNLPTGPLKAEFDHFWTPKLTAFNDAVSRLGRWRTDLQVMVRGIEELDPAAVQQVLDMCETDDPEARLYRGEERLPHLRQFQRLQKQLRGKPVGPSHWKAACSPAATLRNTLIGKLVEDLANGGDVDKAVAAYEKAAAPENYRRSKAPITAGMVQKALGTVQELGLEHALQRRLAQLTDLKVTNILWVGEAGRKVAPNLSPVQELLQALTENKKLGRPEGEIQIREFLCHVLPTAARLQLFLDARHTRQFTALTTGDAGLFPWPNSFSWAYAGDLASASRVKERVKAAGGDVDGELRISLSWDYTDDLDLHLQAPNTHVYYADRNGYGASLDVDANGMDGVRPDPVENITFAWLAEARHIFWVDNFSRRSDGRDYQIEIESKRPLYVGKEGAYSPCSGPLLLEFSGVPERKYSYSSPERSEVLVNDCGVYVTPHHTLKVVEQVQAVQWGVQLGAGPVDVTTVMRSPNCWAGEALGHEHVIFALAGCAPDAPVRGFFNEQLRPELHQHRKVFEVLASRTKAEPIANPVAGVGFSTTEKAEVAAIVTDHDGISRHYTIKF